ncbi:MAG: hypothetical protein NT004_17860 [Bacteroidetes bacterium]|nr:hypothetical protein [Bacteroidota bacterium]
MKKILNPGVYPAINKISYLIILLLLLVSGGLTAQSRLVSNSAPKAPLTPLNLPVTFDDATVNYDLVDFGGNASNIENDPVVPTNKVCKTIKTNTAVSWAGTTLGGSTGGFATAVPFAPGFTTMSMRVYSTDAGIPIRMKVEDPIDGSKSVETEALTTTVNAWETLVFNFANQSPGTPVINYTYNYKKLSVFFNFGVTGATAGNKTYFWDDVAFGGIAPTLINVTFQVKTPDSLPVYVFGSWSNWINWPGNVMTPAGTGFYATTFTLAANSNYEFLYVNGNTPIKEALNPAWPCTNGNATNTNRVLTLGSSDTTICFTWATCTTCTAPILIPVDLPVTFDNGNVKYELVDFGGNVSNIQNDPVNPTNMVCKIIKTNTAETWAGTTIGGTVGFATAIPFAPGSTKMNMRVYSPDAGIPVRVKVEDPNDPTKSVETEKVTLGANAWEFLEFDFSHEAPGTAAINFGYIYKKLSVFFNFGTAGAIAGTKTYYFDDVAFGPIVSVTSVLKDEIKVSLSREGLHFKFIPAKLFRMAHLIRFSLVNQILMPTFAPHFDRRKMDSVLYLSS